MESVETIPDLDKLAEAAGMSRFHFHRVFKSVTGVTPKEYGRARRAGRVRDALAKTASVTEAIYDAGYNANSRFYEEAGRQLGMRPREYRDRGNGTVIRFAVGQCSLGAILVASTDKGVCAILLGDDPGKLVRDLQDQFAKAELIGADKEFESTVAIVVGFIDSPRKALGLPLDVRGTAFQRQVWEALCRIPAGSTATYAALAQAIDHPKAVRAVAQACASNMLAVAIPCHRVVRSDGEISGYRWGVERKHVLLDREAA
jgi:AraC family transcriptional regulator of adaptative response/methylated-DNA-[protein]-cysteine methyltransferase